MTSPLAAALSFALLGLSFSADAAPPVAANAPSTLRAEAPADARFRAIYEKEWAWRQAETGQADEDTDTTGDNTRLPDVGPAAQQARLAVWDGVLKQLDGIDPATLSPANQVNYAIYRPQVENLAAEVRLRAYEMPFNSDSSFWSNLGFMAQRPMKTAAEYRAYIARLNDVPRYFDQQVANMRAGLARGFSVPRAVLDGRDGSIATVAQVSDPTESTFYAPFKQLPAQIPAAEQAQLRAQAKAAVSGAVIPAYARLLTFFRNDYVPKARTTWPPKPCPTARRSIASRSANTPRWISPRTRSTRSAWTRWRASRPR